MFHVSHNRRAIYSATQLRRGLERLLQTNPFDRISVSMLCMESGVSRPTFYRLFDTTTDVVAWYCDCQSRDLCNALRRANMPHGDAPFAFNLRYILERPESLELAWRCKRIDLADAAFYRNMNPLLEERNYFSGLTERDKQVSGRLVSAIISSAVCGWLESDRRKETLDEYYDRILRILETLR